MTTVNKDQESIYKTIKDALDLFWNVDKLEDSLMLLTEEQRDELYSHPILNEDDLLP